MRNGKATTGKPRAAAQRAASREPREWRGLKKTTNADASAMTACVRAAKRPRSGNAGPPPAHQTTAPPAATNRDTAAEAEPDQEPTPPGPKDAKQRTAEAGTAPSAAASAPVAQPTTNDAPAATTERDT